MAIKVYGMSGCDTVRNAVKILESKNVEVDYTHYPKTEGLDSLIADWFKRAGKENVLNLRSRRFKALPVEIQQELINDDQKAIEALIETPHMLKRPILDNGEVVLTGFKKEEWETLI